MLQTSLRTSMEKIGVLHQRLADLVMLAATRVSGGLRTRTFFSVRTLTRPPSQRWPWGEAEAGSATRVHHAGG